MGGKPGLEEKDRDMIKLNETSSASVSLMGEDELSQVVGGCCYRRRRYHCGGWRRPEYRDSGYGKGDSGYSGYEGGSSESEGYEGEDYASESYEGGNSQVAQVSVS
ncbi:MAG: hypothetical protein RL033_3651, partial [Pseudomonadota bacterium]